MKGLIAPSSTYSAEGQTVFHMADLSLLFHRKGGVNALYVCIDGSPVVGGELSYGRIEDLRRQLDQFLEFVRFADEDEGKGAFL